MINKIKSYFRTRKDKKVKNSLENKRRNIIIRLRDMHAMFKKIENSLPHRQAKKNWRYDFIRDGKVGEEIISNLIKYYEEMGLGK